MFILLCTAWSAMGHKGNAFQHPDGMQGLHRGSLQAARHLVQLWQPPSQVLEEVPLTQLRPLPVGRPAVLQMPWSMQWVGSLPHLQSQLYTWKPAPDPEKLTDALYRPALPPTVYCAQPSGNRHKRDTASRCVPGAELNGESRAPGPGWKRAVEPPDHAPFFAMQTLCMIFEFFNDLWIQAGWKRAV